MTKKSTALISKVYRNPKYSGKHVIIIGGEIYAKKTGSAKSKLLEKLIKKYPKEKPIIAYVPKEDTLILLL
ncbi:MAG: DUF5678 domain-containing protein [Patescibacteria group bacterium]|nr:hypothetical protein [Patescibacteria group bacterium]